MRGQRGLLTILGGAILALALCAPAGASAPGGASASIIGGSPATIDRVPLPRLHRGGQPAQRLRLHRHRRRAASRPHRRALRRGRRDRRLHQAAGIQSRDRGRQSQASAARRERVQRRRHPRLPQLRSRRRPRRCRDPDPRPADERSAAGARGSGRRSALPGRRPRLGRRLGRDRWPGAAGAGQHAVDGDDGAEGRHLPAQDQGLLRKLLGHVPALPARHAKGHLRHLLRRQRRPGGRHRAPTGPRSSWR